MNKAKVIKHRMTALIAVILLICADLVTKSYAAKTFRNSPKVLIPGALELTYFENRGAAFSMLQGKFTFFYIGTVIVLLAIIYVYLKMPDSKRFNLLRITLVFLCAGAIGNFIDRIALQYVRDFIYFSLINFPIFNVADIYVTCSAIALALLILFYYKDEEFSFLKLKKDKDE